MSGFLDFLSDPKFLNDVGTGVQAAGQSLTAKSYGEIGVQQRDAAEFQATQLRQQADDAMASAQRRAWSDERAARYVQSDTLAKAAASGGGASDPTVINIIAGQAAEGSYRTAVDLYEGTSKQRLLQLQAQAKEAEGQNAQRRANDAAGAARLGVGATLLKGYAKDASLLQRFGGGGPQSTGSGDSASAGSLYEEVP